MNFTPQWFLLISSHFDFDSIWTSVCWHSSFSGKTHRHAHTPWWKELIPPPALQLNNSSDTVASGWVGGGGAQFMSQWRQTMHSIHVQPLRPTRGLSFNARRRSQTVACRRWMKNVLVSGWSWAGDLRFFHLHTNRLMAEQSVRDRSCWVRIVMHVTRSVSWLEDCAVGSGSESVNRSFSFCSWTMMMVSGAWFSRRAQCVHFLWTQSGFN